MRRHRQGVARTRDTPAASSHPTAEMWLQAAEAVAFVLQGYLGLGLLFAVLLFLPFGASRVDPHLEGAPLAVRALILPGVAIFWPLLAWRWATGQQAPVESSPHRARAARERRR